MRKLTKKERNKVLGDIFAFVLSYFQGQGYMPTREEIGWHFGYTKQWADLQLQDLEKTGKIRLRSDTIRGIDIIQK